MEDQVMQINMGDDQNPKPIFICKNLTLEELQSLLELINKIYGHHCIELRRYARVRSKDSLTTPQR